MNLLDQIQEAELELKKMKQIANTIQYRENRGFPKDGKLIVDFHSSKRKLKLKIDNIKKPSI